MLKIKQYLTFFFQKCVRAEELFPGEYYVGRIIMKTCPCNIQRIFSPVKIENFIGFLKIFFLFLLKTEIVGTR